MSVHEGSGQLAMAMKELLGHWEETKQAWNDPVGRSFEQEHLVPLTTESRTAIAALGQMALVLDDIRRECT